MSIIHSLWVDEVSSPSSKMVPPPRPRTRGAKAEERNMMAKSGGKGGVERVREREAGMGSKRKWAQVTIAMDLTHDVGTWKATYAETLRLLSQTKRIVQVTCYLEGVEELQDLVLGKRMLKEEQVEVRFG